MFFLHLFIYFCFFLRKEKADEKLKDNTTEHFFSQLSTSILVTKKKFFFLFNQLPHKKSRNTKNLGKFGGHCLYSRRKDDKRKCKTGFEKWRFLKHWIFQLVKSYFFGFNFFQKKKKKKNIQVRFVYGNTSITLDKSNDICIW